MTPDFSVAIIGAGFGGIGMAARLKRAGIGDLVLLERGEAVGGTWRDNSYPGAACDVPSHLYCFSFAPNPGWSRSFSPQPEIWDYLQRVADDEHVAGHIRFGRDVTAARWDPEGSLWHIETQGPGGETGSLTARFVVSAAGPLSNPLTPAIPGLDSFAGTVFHSATWDHSHDLTGRKVAVIGTGASAIQFVPKIQPKVGQLHLFQRTPPWIIPRRDRAITPLEHWLFRRVPVTQKVARAGIYWFREGYALGFVKRPDIMTAIQRIAQRHLYRQVGDPALRTALTPAYRMGCKRILISNDFYPTLTQPNVSVVTDAPCGSPAAARAGTWTRRGATWRCGRTSPGRSPGRPATSTPPATTCSSLTHSNNRGNRGPAPGGGRFSSLRADQLVFSGSCQVPAARSPGGLP